MRVERHETFTIDRYGFRNPPDRAASGNVAALLLGDSFSAGSGVADDLSLGGQLTAAWRLPTYTLAPILISASSVQSFMTTLRMKPGSWIIHQQTYPYGEKQAWVVEPHAYPPVTAPRRFAQTVRADVSPLRIFVNQAWKRLQNGDWLTRAEFERRYNVMPPHIRAELIEGVVHMSSPVRHEQHGGPHIRLGGWIVNYVGATPGTDCSDNATVRLDLDNEPQPDVVLFLLPECDGQLRLSADGYLEGAPELAIEVLSPDDRHQDLLDKIDDYLAFGIPAVWVVNPETSRAWIYDRNGAREVKDGVLRNQAGDLEIPLSAL